MTEVIDAITRHHAELADRLRRQVNDLVDGASNARLGELVAFLDQDLLPHADGEERELYPLVDPLVARYARPTATMSVDHEFVRRYRDEIEQAAQRIRTTRDPEIRFAAEVRLRRLVVQLQALLEVHLAKEERVYLPLIAAHLDESKQRRMLDAMHEGPAAPAGSDEDVAVLDVREVPPPRRHPLIFGTFERLAPGAAFVLVNDHDPKPLYHHFNAERAGQFGWEYLEQGPVWRVRISKRAA